MLDNNRFDYLSFYERQYIRSLLIKYTKLYFENPIKYGVGKINDTSLDILNGYLKKTAKPQWFDLDNQQLMGDCYDYISLIKDYIEDFQAEGQFDVLFPDEIILPQQKLDLQKLLSNPVLKDTKMQNGKSFSDIDLHYIKKDKYEAIVGVVNKYIQMYRG